MRKVIEYTLVSADGAFDDPGGLGFMQYQDDAYLRDGLGLLTACDAMLFGRSTYQIFAKLYQGGRAHPWAAGCTPSRSTSSARRWAAPTGTTRPSSGATPSRR